MKLPKLAQCLGLVGMLCAAFLATDGGNSLAAAPKTATRASAVKIATVPGSTKIQGLIFNPSESKTAVELAQGSWQIQASLRGVYNKEDASLILADGTKIPCDETGHFTLTLPMPQPSANVELIAISPRGTVERQAFKVTLNSYQEYRALLAGKTERKRLSMAISTGVSYLSYAEGAKRLTELGTTFKFASTFALFPPSWDIGMSAYVTGFALSKTWPQTLRFLGINGRVGYAIPFVAEPWRLIIMTGAYYTTTTVIDNSVGFKNMMGPQLFPTFRRALSNGKTIFAYCKYSPISAGGLSVLRLSNREIAVGGSYSWPLSQKFMGALSLDLANLAVGIGGTDITSNSVSVGFSVGI